MSLWGRIFAAGYDTFQASIERNFMGRIRDDLLAQASGSVIEIGAGTGVNLSHYPPSVTRLVCTEPEEPMARRLRRKAYELGRDVEVVEAPAESLPFADDAFDTAVATLVLCTVSDPAKALREIARVLRPGGRLIFIEHVRSPEPRLARWQDRLHPLWVRFGHGCHCNRPTLETIEASPFQVEFHRRGRIPKAPPIVRPLLTGVAVAP
ncbi:MAG: class I SAM-dependent methyltransferase [Actinobacteria bacterium]|nr:MAG: class I SAM-dependent methyltransferase [Actinomycetota bacterium]